MDTQEQLEMAMLDKEVAEERAEITEAELEEVKEKLAIVEVEMEVLKEGGGMNFWGILHPFTRLSRCSSRRRGSYYLWKGFFGIYSTGET